MNRLMMTESSSLLFPQDQLLLYGMNVRWCFKAESPMSKRTSGITEDDPIRVYQI